MLSVNEINLLQAQNEGLKKQNAELQKENTKLKEEIEIRDNLSEKFRKEALSWANIANDYQKDRTKLEQTLQEIKAIVKNVCNGCTSECDCNEDCNYFLITEALTKAESEEE